MNFSQALVGPGILDSFIVAEQIPAQLSDTDTAFGLDAEDDDFLTVLCDAMPDDGSGDEARSTAWREESALAALRMRDTRPDHQSQMWRWL